MESPAQRLLALLSLLQTRPHWNAFELGERLDVTQRTVRRDVARLRDLGYPVLAEPGPNGGYELGAGGSLPPLLLTDDEAVAVALGLRAAASGGVAGFEDVAIAALAKLEQVLPVRLREEVMAITTATVLARPYGGPLVNPEALLLLAQACRSLERVSFRYRDGEGIESDRRVEPYRLVTVSRRWYLVGRDLDRDDWRTFRVDRMSRSSRTGHRFVRTSEPDAAQMVADGIAVHAHPVKAEVDLKVGLDRAAEVIPSTVGRLDAIDDTTTRVQVGANDVEWIARYLAALPFDFEVRSPPELTTALRALGRRLSRQAAPAETVAGAARR
ncbi:MAG: helix-turn-helix transcriptional regulator [Acidimicrobiales bacterium]